MTDQSDKPDLPFLSTRWRYPSHWQECLIIATPEWFEEGRMYRDPTGSNMSYRGGWYVRMLIHKHGIRSSGIAWRWWPCDDLHTPEQVYESLFNRARTVKNGIVDALENEKGRARDLAREAADFRLKWGLT